MKDAIEIHNEKCPYLREVWAAGYDEVVEDQVNDQLLLIRKKDQFIKKINRDLILMQKPFNIKTAVLIDGEIHKWISEADGSAERFRQLIN